VPVSTVAPTIAVGRPGKGRYVEGKGLLAWAGSSPLGSGAGGVDAVVVGLAAGLGADVVAQAARLAQLRTARATRRACFTGYPRTDAGMGGFAATGVKVTT
jgi:hypothetical protein